MTKATSARQGTSGHAPSVVLHELKTSKAGGLLEGSPRESAHKPAMRPAHSSGAWCPWKLPPVATSVLQGVPGLHSDSHEVCVRQLHKGQVARWSTALEGNGCPSQTRELHSLGVGALESL